MTDFDRLRVGMVDGQIRTADVTDHRVISAFLSVPREDYVPEARRGLAYLDARVPLGAPGRATLDPMTLAKLVQLADPQEDDKVLVVGCGLGYAVAIFAELAGSVVGLEVEPTLAVVAEDRFAGRAGVKIVEGPLPEGSPADAPFDLIFCDGSVSTRLDALARQLAPDGRLIAITGDGRSTKATVLRRAGDGVATSTAFDAFGPALPGFERAETFAF
ncbi:protein-L-isoaspartate O-methyltransferase [Chelatococcus sambhunathii]|uniref:Protein-L-isoaspartate O-methyltransferase n=1 Tax=Chelatococcus sambhunathii TaxID=363953 RepID=A0ABU1DDI0_9HYPH|nr:protein-L-isoaspartate O-methyltransferase [Chelatococcus sambhunathii]MDR4306103.1 protein-L-isoaspartate O-methyltransferase [Chelatococcus sambhunathii]